MDLTLKTHRLILRPLELADSKRTQLLFPHWEIVQYLAKQVPWPYPANGAYTYYHDVALPAMARAEQWHWTLRLKARQDEHIGSIGLIKSEKENRGFWLGLDWHGQGLMTEACNAVTAYWFDVLRSPVLRVTKAVANTASRRISEKQGMRVIGTEEREYVSGRFLAEAWEITAEEWHSRNSKSILDYL